MSHAAHPGYQYTWLQNVTGPLEGIIESVEAQEAGYYASIKSGLGVDAEVDVHEEVAAIAHSWLVCGVLIGCALVARGGLNAARGRGGNLQYVPDRTLSVRNVFELVVGGFFELVSSILGKADGVLYFPLLGGLFVYILASNVMGLLPGFISPTHSFQTNLAMALVVLLVFAASGIQRNGLDFFKHMLGPVPLLAPLILPVELISTFFARPFALTLRLTGNMFGDHLVFGIMSDLVPIVWPCVFLALGLFVSVIQAVVFSLLSTVYIAVSVATVDHGDHAHH